MPLTADPDTAGLLLSYGLRPFPGLRERNGSAPTTARLTVMERTLEQVARAGYAEDLDKTDPEADFEDFWEDALRIASVTAAADRAGLDDAPLPYAHEWTDAQMSRRLGPVGIVETGHHGIDGLAAHPLMADPAFTGREIVPTTYTSPLELEPLATGDLVGGTDLTALPKRYAVDTLTVLRNFYHRGHDRAVIKLAGVKQGLTTVRLSDDAQALSDQLFDGDFGWSMLRYEGMDGGLVVSPWVEMAYEYRVFIVDGVPVTGAGCVEEATPLDHDPAWGPFSPLMREHRGNSIAAAADSAPEHRPGLALAYRAFAEKIAAALPAGQRTVDVDLAVIPGREEPVVIEFNSVPNAGLYAIDVDALADALVGAADRGYGAESRDVSRIRLRRSDR